MLGAGSVLGVRRMVLMAMLSASESFEIYPMQPVYGPLVVGSSSLMICMARILGAPVMEPPGSVALRRSTVSLE